MVAHGFAFGRIVFEVFLVDVSFAVIHIIADVNLFWVDFLRQSENLTNTHDVNDFDFPRGFSCYRMELEYRRIINGK